MLGYYFPIYVILAVILLFLVHLYLIQPVLVYLHSRRRAAPVVELIDWQTYPLPEAFRERLERDSSQLQAAGFIPYRAFVAHILENTYENIAFVFVNRETRTQAGVAVTLFNGAAGTFIVDVFTSVASKYQLPRNPRLQTLNQHSVIRPQLRHLDVVHAFPHVQDANRLLELHQKLELRHFPGTPKEILDDEAEAEFLANTEAWRKEIMADWIATGKLEPIPNEADYRVPLLTTYLNCWGQLPPFSFLLKAMRRKESKRLEREVLSAGV